MKPTSMESQCDALITSVYGSGAIVRLGAKGKRTRNTEGVPDRLYWCGGRMVYFEVKSATDYLSPQQYEFLRKILVRNGIAGCGSRDDLLALLNAPYPADVGYDQIAKYRTRAGRPSPSIRGES